MDPDEDVGHVLGQHDVALQVVGKLIRADDLGVVEPLQVAAAPQETALVVEYEERVAFEIRRVR